MPRTDYNHLRPDIHRLTKEGWNASEIADQLQISIDTVRYHQKKGMPYSARQIQAKITVSDIDHLRRWLKVGDKIWCRVEEINKNDENLPTKKTKKRFYILKKLPHGILIGQKNQKISYKMVTYVDILLAS